jgi:hypothetical protein
MIFNIYGTVSLIAGSSFYLRDNIERMIFTMINSNNYKEVFVWLWIPRVIKIYWNMGW